LGIRLLKIFPFSPLSFDISRMPVVQFTDLSGSSLSADLPGTAKFHDASQFLATSLGLRPHQIRILNFDSPSLHRADSSIFTASSTPSFYFQVLYRHAPSPIPPISHSLLHVMTQSQSQSYDHSRYRDMLHHAPRNMDALIAQLLPICPDRAKCEEALLTSGGDVNEAANALTTVNAPHHYGFFRRGQFRRQLALRDMRDERLAEAAAAGPPGDPLRQRMEAAAEEGYQRAMARIGEREDEFDFDPPPYRREREPPWERFARREAEYPRPPMDRVPQVPPTFVAAPRRVQRPAPHGDGPQGQVELTRERVFAMLRERFGADDDVLNELLADNGGDLAALLNLID
jgi:hypothetical protein